MSSTNLDLKNYYFKPNVCEYTPQIIEISKRIFLVESGSRLFNEKVREAFKTIGQGEVGQRLLAKIASGKHDVLIKHGTRNNACPEDIFHDNQDSRIKGKGCETIISLTLNEKLFIDTDIKQFCLEPREIKVFDRNGELIESPFFVTVAHELIHAAHNSYGKSRIGGKTTDSTVWTSDEEFHTIEGFPSKKPFRIKPKISENAIRREHKLPERFGHKAPNQYEEDRYKLPDNFDDLIFKIIQKKYDDKNYFRISFDF